MPSAACEHALTISTSGRAFLHSWDSIWGLEQCNSTRCLPGTGTPAKPYRYSSHLFPRAEKRAVCSAIRRHFLQGVLMMSAHLLWTNFPRHWILTSFACEVFFQSKRRERFRTSRLMKKFCNLINRRTRKSSLLYGWIALWCDPNSSVCVRIYLIFQEFTTCLLVKYTIKFLKHTNIFAM